MVKIKTIARSEFENTRDCKFDIEKITRSLNPNLHQFAKAREYQRALNAVKMGKMFAKPFLGALTLHSDGISVLSKNRNSVSRIISGSFNGELIYWDISKRKALFQADAHRGGTKGAVCDLTSKYIVSCGDDNQIKIWNINDSIANSPIPTTTYTSKQNLNSLDHSWLEDKFVTTGKVVQIWNYERSSPIMTLQWNIDSFLNAKFNPSEPNIIATTDMDRGITIYDIRGKNPLSKTILLNKSYGLSWNPQEPLNFTVANDDSNCYSFDMRKLEVPKMIHKDHIQAVVDIDYSATGKSFVTASWDKTVRIFNSNEGKSCEVYHGKRIQKVFSVAFSQDGEYVLSGSDDTNIRIWKSKAAREVGFTSFRQKSALDYQETLKDKFKHNKEIKRIEKHRHLPKYLLNAKKRIQIMKESKVRKIENQELNNPNIFEKPKPERQAKVVVNEE